MIKAVNKQKLIVHSITCFLGNKLIIQFVIVHYLNLQFLVCFYGYMLIAVMVTDGRL